MIIPCSRRGWMPPFDFIHNISIQNKLLLVIPPSATFIFILRAMSGSWRFLVAQIVEKNGKRSGRDWQPWGVVFLCAFFKT